MSSKQLGWFTFALAMLASVSACGDSQDIRGPTASDNGDSGLIRIEVRTQTTEGMLLHAAEETRTAMSELGNVSEPVTLEFYSKDDGAGLFALTWSPAVASGTGWKRVEVWEALNGAQEGRFLSGAGSRPVAAFCGSGIKEGMFGPRGTNPGYFEGFCRLLTSNSLPWAEYDGAAR
jgi:hypothetical protein